jgi:hypothetical protein
MYNSVDSLMYLFIKIFFGTIFVLKISANQREDTKLNFTISISQLDSANQKIVSFFWLAGILKTKILITLCLIWAISWLSQIWNFAKKTTQLNAQWKKHQKLCGFFSNVSNLRQSKNGLNSKLEGINWCSIVSK